MFRADLIDCEGFSYHCDHFVASANQIESELQNSDTLLLLNMTPQEPRFNSGLCKKLERNR